MTRSIKAIFQRELRRDKCHGEYIALAKAVTGRKYEIRAISRAVSLLEEKPTPAEKKDMVKHLHDLSQKGLVDSKNRGKSVHREVLTVKSDTCIQNKEI